MRSPGDGLVLAAFYPGIGDVVAVHCATDPVMYGVQQPTNRSVLSPSYRACPERNQVGNCNGWITGCAHLTCQRQLSAPLVARAVRDVIPMQGA